MRPRPASRLLGDDRGRRAARERRRRRSRGRRSVSPLMAKKASPGADRAAVDRDAGDRLRARAERPARRRREEVVVGPERPAHAASSAASAARDRFVVGERDRLARRRSGRSRGPCRRRRGRRPARAWRRRGAIASRAVADLDGAGRAGEDRLADRGRILGARIVVGDDDHVGVPAAASPISGRLPGSRSPPAPKTTTSRPCGHRAERLRARSPARRACGRSRRRPARRSPCGRRVRAGPARPSSLPSAAKRVVGVDAGADGEAGGDQRVRRLEGAGERQHDLAALAEGVDVEALAEAVRRRASTSRISSPAAADADEPLAALRAPPRRRRRRARRPCR